MKKNKKIKNSILLGLTILINSFLGVSCQNHVVIGKSDLKAIPQEYMVENETEKGIRSGNYLLMLRKRDGGFTVSLFDGQEEINNQDLPAWITVRGNDTLPTGEYTEKEYKQAYSQVVKMKYGFCATANVKTEHGSAFIVEDKYTLLKTGVFAVYRDVKVEKAQREVETMIREEGEAAALEVGVTGIHPELIRLLGRMKFRTSYGQNALKHSIEVAQLSGLLAAELGLDVRLAKRAGLLHDIGKAVDHEMEGSHIQLGAELCRKYKENATVINAVESHHGDVEPTSLIACIVQAADTISAARPGARRETLETYTSRLRQLEDITNNFKGVDKSFAIQAGREVRVMVVPEQISDADMVLLARDISKQIEAELEYPGQIKVNVIRESRVIDYAK